MATRGGDNESARLCERCCCCCCCSCGSAAPIRDEVGDVDSCCARDAVAVAVDDDVARGDVVCGIVAELRGDVVALVADVRGEVVVVRCCCAEVRGDVVFVVVVAVLLLPPEDRLAVVVGGGGDVDNCCWL